MLKVRRNCLVTRVAPKGSIEDLRRIEAALQAAETLVRNFSQHNARPELKIGGDPVTEADRAVNELLLQILPRGEEGWLSEETADDGRRLSKNRVWIVDPLDGTKEFLAGIPEWCISIALVEDNKPIAGGICNPARNETFLGSLDAGIQFHIVPEQAPAPQGQNKPIVLASRSEMNRGEWDWLRDSPFEIRSVGSVAYKLALVAAGQADATWTLTPKHEWDVAAGVALVLASGGTVRRLKLRQIAFNQVNPRWEGLVAFSAIAQKKYATLFEDWLSRRI